MTSPESVSERLSIRVRVNPESAKLGPRNPAYLARYEEDLARVKADYLKSLKEGVESGEIELPEPEEGSVAPTPELQLLFVAQGLANRDMTIAAVLGGHGVPQPAMSVWYYHGAEVRYIPDPEVPVGGFELEGDLDKTKVFDQLRALT